MSVHPIAVIWKSVETVEFLRHTFADTPLCPFEVQPISVAFSRVFLQDIFATVPVDEINRGIYTFRSFPCIVPTRAEILIEAFQIL